MYKVKGNVFVKMKVNIVYAILLLYTNIVTINLQYNYHLTSLAQSGTNQISNHTITT